MRTGSRVLRSSGCRDYTVDEKAMKGPFQEQGPREEVHDMLPKDPEKAALYTELLLT